MYPKLLVRRRPSAPLVISSVALFVAMGGVGWAATQLPADSVGNAQLQNGAVTNWKIADAAVGNHKLQFGSVGRRKIADGAVSSSKIGGGAVGSGQINADQVQARITGKCSGATGAIGSVDNHGAVHCDATLPQEFGTTSSSVKVLTSSTPIATKPLASGSYVVFANPHAQITGTVAGQQVEVDCTLSVSPSNGASETRTLVVETGPSRRSQAGTIPLVVPASTGAAGSTAGVSCIKLFSAGAAPTITVQTTINAIQTAANG